MSDADEKLPQDDRRHPPRHEQRPAHRRQLYVSLRGEVIADVALGLARDGVPMRRDTLMLWLSAGKPVSAVAVAQLWERGLLDLDDPVAKHIPEFAANGKDVVTIRHILTHTGGFRGAARALGGQTVGRGDRRAVRHAARAALGAGRDSRVSPAHELVPPRRARPPARRPAVRSVRARGDLRAGRHDDSWIGMPPERYRAYGDRIGLMHEMKDGQATANYALDREDLRRADASAGERRAGRSASSACSTRRC